MPSDATVRVEYVVAWKNIKPKAGLGRWTGPSKRTAVRVCRAWNEANKANGQRLRFKVIKRTITEEDVTDA